MKARTIIIAGSFAQTALAVLGITAAAIGLLAAGSVIVEGVCCALASQRQE